MSLRSMCDPVIPTLSVSSDLCHISKTKSVGLTLHVRDAYSHSITQFVHGCAGTTSGYDVRAVSKPVTSLSNLPRHHDV